MYIESTNLQSAPEWPAELHVENDSDFLIVEAARDANDDDDNDGDSDADKHDDGGVAERRTTGLLSAPLTGRLREIIEIFVELKQI